MSASLIKWECEWMNEKKKKSFVFLSNHIRRYVTKAKTSITQSNKTKELRIKSLWQFGSFAEKSLVREFVEKDVRFSRPFEKNKNEEFQILIRKFS